MSNIFEIISSLLITLYSWVWGPPLLLLLMGVGIYLTIALRGIQIRYLPYALKLAFGNQHQGEGAGDISHFASLMTALAATIGIGNIAGVSTAITIGGFGALFWMWVTALVGMAIKYSEAILAVKYRSIDKRGEMSGGPMYFIEKGLGWRWLAIIFAVFGAIGAFGGGNILQANSVAEVVHGMFDIDHWITGTVVAALTGMTLIGGIRSIGRVASVLVPFMAIFYIGTAIIILIMHYEHIPATFGLIFSSAFTGEAATGGFIGTSVMVAIQVGVSRGLMTSEAGLGTASMGGGAAKTDFPGRQALVSMTGCFLATIIMCSATGLVLGVTDVLGSVDANGKVLNGAKLTLTAFQSVFPFAGGYIVTTGLLFFAFTTLLGWAYYGEKCVEYLFGERSISWYRFLFTLIIIPGAVLELDLVWIISDICNGLMAFPNLICICALSGVVIAETKSFLKIVRKERNS